MNLGMFFYIFPVVVNIKNTVYVVGQFAGYFIINALIVYLVTPFSITFSHDLTRLELGDQCFRFGHIFLHYGNKEIEGCIKNA